MSSYQDFDQVSDTDFQPITKSHFSDSCFRRNEIDENPGMVTKKRRKKGRGNLIGRNEMLTKTLDEKEKSITV